MALGLPEAGGGNRVPIVKYDARAGRLFRVDREKGMSGQFESHPVEITAAFQAVFDLERIELGWLSFPTNAAPSIVTAPYGEPLPPRPDANHRTGFRVNILLGRTCGGDVREMAANADASIKGMDALHDAYLAGVKGYPGKLPVVKLGGTTAKVTQGKAATSTNYIPVWEIVAWVDRPASLSAEAIAALRTGGPEGAAPAPQPVQQPLPVPPPPAPVMASIADDF